MMAKTENSNKTWLNVMRDERESNVNQAAKI